MHLEQSLQNSCILYHTATIGSANSCDPIQLLRRFSHILLEQLPPSCEESFLIKEFPIWLEKSCTKYKNGVVIVIDGADLIKNNSEFFKWVLDPLPVPVRIVISVSSHAYPHAWSTWPTLSIQGNTSEGFLNLKSKFPNHSNVLEQVMEILFPDGVYNKSASNNLSNCLFRNTLEALHKNTLCDLTELVSKCLMTSKLQDFFCLIIDRIINENNKELVSKILCLLAISCNGLSIMELTELCHEYKPADICFVLILTCKLYLTWDICGLIQLTRIQVG